MWVDEIATSAYINSSANRKLNQYTGFPGDDMEVREAEHWKLYTVRAYRG